MKKIFFLIVFFPLMLLAQDAPWFSRQIYANKLRVNDPKDDDFATLDNRNGHWVSDGWYARFQGVDGSRLVITFKNGLPLKGRLSFGMRNINLYEDVSAKDHVIAMLTSSIDGEPDHFDSDGAWMYIRTGTEYKRSNGACGLLVDAGSNGLDSRQRTYAASNQQWDRNKGNNFQIIWDQNHLWIYLNYNLVAQVPFENQKNRFRQLWLAGDGNVPTITEPVFSGLRIFTTDEPIHVLEKFSGDAQTGSIGSTLSSPLQVQLTTDDGSPIAGKPITFEIETGGGNFDGELQRTVNTGQDGIADIDWTLGQIIGEQQVRAEYKDMNVLFTATATAGEPSTLVQLQGSGQTVNPGVAFPQPFQVRVDDSFGNPMSDQTVNFEITAGNGSLNGQSYAAVVTDVNGIASVFWTPDSLKGAPNTLQAGSQHNGSALQNSPVEWHYPAADINPQYSEIQATGPKLADGQDISTVVVTLRNSQNNPVGSGYKVRLSVSGSGNSLVWQNQITDTNGQAKAYLSSTRAETKSLAATVSGPDINLAQQATVTFEPETVEPNSLMYVSGNQQTVAAGTLAEPLSVRVVNPNGNPVANQQVTFTSISGGGTFSGQSTLYVTTDANGLAQATPRVSTTAGMNHTFSASADTLENSPILFTLTSKAGTGRNLNIIQGNNQTGYPASTLPNPVILQLTDAYGNPVANESVTFTLETGDCFINGSQTTQIETDGNGRVSVTISLGDEITQSSVIVSTPQASTRITVNTVQNINLPDLNRSSISATSPITPDGQAASTVTVTVLNQLSEPVEGIQVEVRVSDNRASVSVPDPVSDAQGQVQAYISSTQEGRVTVTAHLPAHNLTLQDQAVITFSFVETGFIATSNIHYTGVVGKPLPEPLAVQLTRGSTPVSGQPVTFSVISGDTRFWKIPNSRLPAPTPKVSPR
ncbi:MAG: Ig-like domain-containing protein [candidate division KSB1 bacterium]|nr:Ig-like domain-containing protein [candidate division KSB1 bacterium]